MARAPYPGELESCPWGIAPLSGRAEVARRYGNKKGNIGKALREAISMWIRQEEKE